MTKVAVVDLCYICHKKEEKEFFKTYMHTPVQNKKCISCHKPHASQHDSLLSSSSEQLCVSCHDNMMVELQDGFSHKPFKEKSCSTCHDPHASENIANTVMPMPGLCYECHEKK